MPRKDFSHIALDVVRQATGEEPKQPSPAPKLVREASRKGGENRAAKLTPEQRSEIARLAAQARWKKS
jgi:hypothetical protein